MCAYQEDETVFLRAEDFLDTKVEEALLRVEEALLRLEEALLRVEEALLRLEEVFFLILCDLLVFRLKSLEFKRLLFLAEGLPF